MKNISILEGLRGWLSIWVMVSHVFNFCSMAPSPEQQQHPLGHLLLILCNGGMAVSVFMILSGFVNFYLLDAKHEKPFVYLFRRFIRLFPLFMTLFVTSIFLNRFQLYSLKHLSWADDSWISNQYLLTVDAYHYLIPNLLAHLVMFQGLVPAQAWPNANSAFLGVDWSISTEWQFYLLAPWLFRWSRTKHGLAWFGLIAILLLWVRLHLAPGHMFNNACLVFWIQFFFVGSASYLIYKQILERKMPTSWAPSLYFLLGVILIRLASVESILMFWAAIFVLVVLCECFPEDPVLRRFASPFTNPLVQYFGRISYSIYLVHWLVIMIVLRAVLVVSPDITPRHAFAFMLPTVALMTFALSHFLYKHIEKPFIDFGKRMSNPQSSSTSGSAG